MLARIRVLALALALTGSAIVLTPLPAAATISGPCTAQGSADGKTIDLGSASEWHMSKTAIATGTGHSEPELTSVSVSLAVLGVPIPIFSQSGKGHGGDGPKVDMQQYSSKARVIGASGSAGPCSGSVTIIFDDQSPTGTAVGLAGIIAFIVGALGTIASSLSRGCFARLLALLMGLIMGLGAGLYGEEAGLLNPFNPLDLLVVVAGGVVALAISFIVNMVRGPARVAS